ncbi:MAG: hypothetical protein ACO31E_05255 [Phycisphaerales bacterium]|jgi:hypothetical protein
MTVCTKFHTLALAAAAAGLATPAFGQALAALNSPAGATATITLGIEITTALGTSSDTDTQVVGVIGSADAQLFASTPPWSDTTLSNLLFDLSDVNFHFDLYCLPVLGCQPLDVQLSAVSIAGTAPISSPIDAAGAVSFVNAPLVVLANYSTTGVATSSGTIVNDTNSTFAGRVNALKGNGVSLDQLSLAPVISVIDPASLPAGVTALTLTLSSNLSTLALSGTWSVGNPYDLDGDGLVAAADLAILLGQWGSSGTADFDGDGIVGPSDLAILLGNWAS